jgi:hypothetical protein
MTRITGPGMMRTGKVRRRHGHTRTARCAALCGGNPARRPRQASVSRRRARQRRPPRPPVQRLQVRRCKPERLRICRPRLPRCHYPRRPISGGRSTVTARAIMMPNHWPGHCALPLTCSQHSQAQPGPSPNPASADGRTVLPILPPALSFKSLSTFNVYACTAAR